MKTRFVITKIDKDGLRTLARPNQGRNHFDSRENAESHLSAILSNNSESTLKSVFGDISKMKVIPTECYDHGDSVGTVFGPDEATYPKLQECTIEPSQAEGSGYRPGRVYYWAAITTGFVEITDAVTHAVTYETGECFARRFTLKA